ncbi:uncharacterized protein A4U43_C09F2430 [Asparagus officinalis]|uniref:Uncharacterized protein n=1 Tax=Asparagus officinalis TaxID=4686 RepID=A0A5P1E9I9_ASPOF|nr:uncharacterized protein LOC109824837 [Asparagus officinalis]ONK57626.1 uncharacterized protein A4U43_C09F2430 [Asparagus officinalis]
MDDFSFPTIQTDPDDCALPFPHFAASPLWYRRSFSSAREAAKVADSLSALSDDEGARACACDKFVSNEEKMDMLWEDFNEDLYPVSCEWKKNFKGKSGSIAEFRYGQAFGVPKRSSSLLPRRKPSLVVMLKVLKKLFLIQKNGSGKRAPVCKI